MAYGMLNMRTQEIGQEALDDLYEMIEAHEEEKSKDREWIAHVAATIINCCKSGKLKKRVMEAQDIMYKSDAKRAAKRYRAAMEAERRRIAELGASPIIASSDWGPV